MFLCTNKESKTMGVLDNDYIRIKEKPLLYVTKLSDMFRYTLQSEKKGLVTLEEE